MKIQRIEDLRIDSDQTQKEIAKLLNITQQQYNLYEKGKRKLPIDKLIILKNHYKVSYEYILEKII